MGNKERFENLFGEIERPGKENLHHHLKDIGYFTCPSSTRYHSSNTGGNLDHSLNVTDKALEIAHTLLSREEYNQLRESIILIGLFHDIGKCSYYNKPLYIENILKSGKRSDKKPYVTNDDRLKLPHEIISLHILSRFIPLTEEEIFSLIHHNGMYGDLKYQLQGKETKLQYIIHAADMWASRFIENDVKIRDKELF